MVTAISIGMNQPATTEPPDLRCFHCGYDLRGLPAETDRCPECGTKIDPAAARIPWERRREIGTTRAYLRTMVLVLFRPGKLAAAVAGPVRFHDARRFSRRTALRAWAPLALLLIWTWLATLRFRVVPDPGYPGVWEWRWRWGAYGLKHVQFLYINGIFTSEPGPVLSLGFALEVLFIVSLLACTYLALLGVSRVASYFFHPGDLSPVRQNRAVAISYYAGAPLSILLLLTPLFVYTWWYYVMTSPDMMSRPPALPPVTIGRWIAVLPAAWCWITSLILLRRTTVCGFARTITMAIGLPIVWAIIIAVALSIPAALLLLSLMLLSLR